MAYVDDNRDGIHIFILVCKATHIYSEQQMTTVYVSWNACLDSFIKSHCDHLHTINYLFSYIAYLKWISQECLQVLLMGREIKSSNKIGLHYA